MRGRLIDLPYHDSPPLLFTYRQTAALAAGSYTFSPPVTKGVFTPSRPILPNALYSFSTMTFAMDIDENDYFGAIATLPSFSMYVQSEAAAPGLREPMVLSKYLANIPYILHILGGELLQDAYPGQTAPATAQGFTHNRLLGSVGGILTQTPALLGKASLTAIIILSAQEIVSEEFVAAFKAESNEQNRRGFQ